ncbi:hypothetical protein D3C72_1636790 [compost metagenome]
MRHDAVQAIRLGKHPGNRQEVFVVARLHTSAMPVAVDFDQRRQALAGRLGLRGNHPCRIDAVDHNRQIHAALAQGQHPRKLARRHAHRVEQIRDASGRELLGFL